MAEDDTGLRQTLECFIDQADFYKALFEVMVLSLSGRALDLAHYAAKCYLTYLNLTHRELDIVKQIQASGIEIDAVDNLDRVVSSNRILAVLFDGPIRDWESAQNALLYAQSALVILENIDHLGDDETVKSALHDLIKDMDVPDLGLDLTAPSKY